MSEKEDYHERTNEDYKKLSQKDKRIIDEIDKLLKNLSEDGKDYWQEYYS